MSFWVLSRFGERCHLALAAWYHPNDWTIGFEIEIAHRQFDLSGWFFRFMLHLGPVGGKLDVALTTCPFCDWRRRRRKRRLSLIVGSRSSA